MEVISFKNTLDKYISFYDWLVLLGLDPTGTRVSFYRKKLELWYENYISVGETLAERSEFTKIYYEISPFLDIYDSFSSRHDLVSALLLEKLRIAIAGPVYINAETEKSKEARNYLFEVLTLARFNSTKAGSDPNFEGLGDGSFRYERFVFNVEAKRVTSKNQVKKRIKKALDQLKKHRANGSAGVIAIEMNSTYFNELHELHVNDESEIQPVLYRLSEKFLDEIRESAQKHLFASRMQWCCVLLYIPAIAWVGGKRIVQCGQWTIDGNPYQFEPSDAMRRFSILLNNTKCYGL